MTIATSTETPTRAARPTSPGPNRRLLACWAGVSYVALFVLAIFANFMVRERLVDQSDPASTFANLVESEQTVHYAVVAFLIIFLLDVFVAWALYYVFRPAGAALSQLTAWFRIVYTVFLGVAMVFLYSVLRLIDQTDPMIDMTQAARESAVMLALDAFNATWLVGLAAFGVHLILIGAMILRSKMAHRLLGIVVGVAGAAYIFDTVAYTLIENYSANADVFTAIVAVPAVIAEAAFTIWLLLGAGATHTVNER